MSLEAALYELTGAGLVACAAGLGLSVPAGAVQSGDAFIGYLSQRGSWGEINRLIEELKRDIVEDARGALTSEADLERQIAEAITCLEEVRPEADLLRSVLTSPPGNLGSPAPAATGPIEPAARIAGQVIARAAAAHPPHLHVVTVQNPTAGPSLGAQRLLHRLFARLLRDPSVIVGLGPVLQDYLAMTSRPVVDPAAAQAPAPVQAPLPVQAQMAPAFASLMSAAAPLGTPRQPAIAALHKPAVPATPGLAARLGVGEAYAGALEATGVVESVERIRAARGLSDGVFSRFLRTLESQACPPGAVPHRLDEMAAGLASLIAALAKPSNEDAETRRMKGEAARELAAGNLEGAMRSLKGVRRSLREGRRRIEERLREDILMLHQQMAGEAGIIARQAEMELTRRDYAAAAELFAEARDNLPGGEAQSAWLYAMRQGEALFRLGDEFEDTRALAESARAYGACLAMTRREEAPRNWVAAQCGIGLAHLRLAERSPDADALARAIEAWRAALSVLVDLAPDEAGQTHVARRHLARALVLLGEHAATADALLEAAEIYRTMIATLAPENSAFDRAEAQASLASTLLLIDERQDEAGSDGRQLTEALSALEAALAVYTRATTPSEWSAASMNKGNSLLALGDREHSLARYEAAAMAFEQALSVQSRETSPTNWGLIQTSLGNAHAAVGEQARDAFRLEKAATAYRQALEVLHGPDQAMRRAIAQLNLGTVLARLAIAGDVRLRLEAMTVMLSALETFKERQASAYASIAELNLRNLHAASGTAPQAKAS